MEAFQIFSIIVIRENKAFLQQNNLPKGKTHATTCKLTGKRFMISWHVNMDTKLYNQIPAWKL